MTEVATSVFSGSAITLETSVKLLCVYFVQLEKKKTQIVTVWRVFDTLPTQIDVMTYTLATAFVEHGV